MSGQSQRSFPQLYLDLALTGPHPHKRIAKQNKWIKNIVQSISFIDKKPLNVCRHVCWSTVIERYWHGYTLSWKLGESIVFIQGFKIPDSRIGGISINSWEGIKSER